MICLFVGIQTFPLQTFDPKKTQIRVLLTQFVSFVKQNCCCFKKKLPSSEDSQLEASPSMRWQLASYAEHHWNHPLHSPVARIMNDVAQL